MNEFDIIQQFFSHGKEHPSVIMGVGDDCALVAPEAHHTLAISVDTIVEGTHFHPNAPAEHLAQRALRVALSDLAAMGAKPQWFTLALTLPHSRLEWLEKFSLGIQKCAETFNCILVGGDTTRGPLSISVQVIGKIPAKQELTRCNAQVGDAIYVTETLGNGAAALAMLQKALPDVSATTEAFLHQHFFYPEPQFRYAEHLTGQANSAIDISDGLLADLQHICTASDVFANLHLEQIPIAPQVKAITPREQHLAWALSGGDDYQLCFTLPEKNRASLTRLMAAEHLQTTEIGTIIEKQETKNGAKNSSITCFEQGNPIASSHFLHSHLHTKGYQHFV